MSSVPSPSPTRQGAAPSQTPRYQLPTHLEVPDTIELPLFGLNISLTLRQAIVFFFGWGIALACWRHTTQWGVLHWGLPGLLALLTFVIAMLQLRGRHVEAWGLIVLRYIATPRLCVWHSVADEHLRQLAVLQQEDDAGAESETEEENPFDPAKGGCKQ